MKPITTAELLKLVSDTEPYDGSFAPQVRRAVAEVFRLRRKLSVMQASKPDPDDTAHTTTGGRTPDFEFPGPWIRFEMSKREMEQQILEEGEVIYLETGLNGDVEVVSNDTKDPEVGVCCVRALNSDGLKWIMKRPEIVEKASKIE